MAIEIVDFPIKNGGSFHGKMLVHQRVDLYLLKISDHQWRGLFRYPMFDPYYTWFYIHSTGDYTYAEATRNKAAKLKLIPLEATAESVNARGVVGLQPSEEHSSQANPKLPALGSIASYSV